MSAHGKKVKTFDTPGQTQSPLNYSKDFKAFSHFKPLPNVQKAKHDMIEYVKRPPIGAKPIWNAEVNVYPLGSDLAPTRSLSRYQPLEKDLVYELRSCKPILKSPLIRDPRSSKFDVNGKLESMGFAETPDEKFGPNSIFTRSSAYTVQPPSNSRFDKTFPQPDVDREFIDFERTNYKKTKSISPHPIPRRGVGESFILTPTSGLNTSIYSPSSSSTSHNPSTSPSSSNPTTTTTTSSSSHKPSQTGISMALGGSANITLPLPLVSNPWITRCLTHPHITDDDTMNIEWDPTTTVDLRLQRWKDRDPMAPTAHYKARSPPSVQRKDRRRKELLEKKQRALQGDEPLTEAEEEELARTQWRTSLYAREVQFLDQKRALSEMTPEYVKAAEERRGQEQKWMKGRKRKRRKLN